MWQVLVGFNVLVFCVYGFDKLKARRGWRRVPEATLLWLTALGAGPGALLAMLCFRHKTRKPRFQVGVPAILIGQVALLLLGRRFGLW